MLELTDQTITALATVAGESRSGGLRIFVEPDRGGEVVMAAVLVEYPSEDDEIVEQDGARVYLDSVAAVELADKVLDTYVEDDKLHLAVLERP